MKIFLQIRGMFAVLVSAALLAGCSQKPAANVLAHVGAKDITVADFKAEYERRQANRLPLPDRQTLLDQMIDRETSLQQAQTAGLDQAADVRRACDDIVLAKFKETQLEPKLAAIKVTPEEVRAAYEKDVARYTQPAKVKLAFIFIAADAKADTNQLAAAGERASEARQLALALPAGARGFGQVAADFSDDQVTRYRGGDAGWFAADSIEARWPAEVVAAGFALKNSGEMSGVLRAGNGFYLVKKLDDRTATVTPLEQVRSTIERRLLLARQQAAEHQFQAQARQAVKVSTDAALLTTLSYPSQNLAQAAPARLPGMPTP